MISLSLQNYLINFSFLSIFTTTIYYWINFSIFSTKEVKKLDDFLISICCILNFLLLICRWITANHFPLSNLYESLLFLTVTLLSFLVYFQVLLKKNFLGVIILPIILFLNTFANFVLPYEMKETSPLIPALQSNWLMMHVTIMMLSYTSLIFGSLLSLTYLIINFFIKKNFSQNIPLFSDFDTLSYRILSFGFPLLTIGILSGSVWANETWGSYWSWDPKETWAFITWLIYAIYFHSRIIKGWTGSKPALIASFGFFIVWICYLGVNAFGQGLHSYGWFF